MSVTLMVTYMFTGFARYLMKHEIDYGACKLIRKKKKTSIKGKCKLLKGQILPSIIDGRKSRDRALCSRSTNLSEKNTTFFHLSFLRSYDMSTRIRKRDAL
jgi:hypothetical protein